MGRTARFTPFPRLGLGLLALLWAAVWLPTAHAQIYIVDGNLNSGAGGVSAFAQGATGNVLPDMTLVGAGTGIGNATGIAANATNLYVLCNNFVDPPFVLKYSLPTAGNAAPVSKTYLAPATGAYAVANAMAIDGTNLYVLDNGTGIGGANGAVNVYPLSSLTGNSIGTPLAAARTITGATNTGLNRPTGLTVDSSAIYVANNVGNNLLIFALNATGDVAPTKTITGLNAPSAVAVDATTIYVFNFGNSRVTTYPVSTSGGAATAATTIGSTSITSGAFYVGVDSNNVYVGDPGDPLGVPVPTVLVFPKTTNNTSATPTATITGTNALTAINSLVVLAPPGTAAPTVTAGSGSTPFTIGGSPVVVDNALTITAVPGALATATIQITGGYLSSEDVLAFTNTSATTYGNIAGVFNVTLGTLRLESVGATATTAQWQAALRAVTYSDTAGSPTTGNRTFSFKVFDGAQTSSAATKTVSVSSAAATTTSATAATAPFSSADQTVALSVTVTSTAGTVNAGTVTFTLKSGSTTIGSAVTSVTITSGTATASYTLPGGTATGSYTIQAVYNAGGSFATSTDSSASLTVFGAPTVTSVTAPASGTYKAGDALNFAVTFSSAVTVTGTPSFAVTVGSASRTATYVSGSGTTTLTFRYTVTLGDNAGSGIAVASPITPNSGTITGAGSLAATLTFTPPTTTSVLVSTVPILASTGGTAAFTSADNAASTPVVVDSGITVSDPSLSAVPANGGGFVTITGNYQSGSDVLSLTSDPATMGDIQGAFSATAGFFPAGTLILASSTGTATIAQWQAALRAVKFTSTAVTPNTANRTVSFTVNDGVQNSAAVTKTVTVTASNQTPVVTTSSGSTTFFVGGSAIAVDSGLTVSDGNNATLASGTVSITGGLQIPEDVLAFTNNNATNFGNIAGSYNTTTGVLTLTSAGATATVAQWQAALQAVTYNDTFSSPNTTTRTLSFVVNDGTANSAVAAKTVTAVVQPVIVSVYPTSGPANNYMDVTLTGVRFGTSVSSLTTVTYILNGQSRLAIKPQWISSTQIVATLGSDVVAGTSVRFVVTVNGVPSAPSTATFTAVTPPSFTSASSISGTIGTPFSFSITTSPAADTLTAIGLPAGLTFDAATGIISGIPTTLGSTTVLLTATKSGATVSTNLTITINSATTVTTAAAASATFGATAQTVMLTANVTSSGGTVNAGTVTFTLKNSSGATLGTAVTSGTVTNGTTTASYTLPAGTVPGAYTIQAVYNAAGAFATSSTSSTSLTVSLIATTTTASGAFTVKTRVSTFVSSGLEAPESMAFDTAGNLYVANVTRSNVSKITPAGAVSTFAGEAASSQVSSPASLAFDAAGNLYIANAQDSGASITKVTPGGRESAFSSVPKVSGGLAFDTAGNLYRANYSGNIIYKITPGGTASTFVSSGLSSPEGLAFDKAGNLYVVNQGLRTISKVTPGGTVSTFVSLGLLSSPGDIAFDAAGNLYVANYSGDAIYKVTPAGTLSTYLPAGAGPAWGLVCDVAGNLYFSDTDSNSIKKVTPVNLVTVAATVTSAAGTVNAGTVTFTLVGSDNKVVGSPVTSGTLSAGTTSVTYPVPGGASSPPYTIQAVYNPAGSFAGSSDSSQKLTPTIAQTFLIYFGQFNNTASASGIGGTASALSLSGGSTRRASTAPASSLAAVINPGGTTGKLVGYIGSISAGFSVDIAIADDNTFTGQTKALTSSTGTGQTLTFSGSIANGVLSGTVAELGLSFTANVDPAAGSSSAIAGLYQASALGAGGGTTYSIVGTQGQVFVLALTPSGVAAGTGTVASDNTFTVQTAQGASVTGTVNPGTTATTATITLPNGGGTIGVSGLSAATPAVHQLANVSTLGTVGSGKIMIEGFVIAGSGPKNVLVRAIGPSLSTFGVSGPLATPTLSILDVTGKTVLSNSGWAGDSTLAAAFSTTGAFPLPAGSLDAAAIATLQPGVYYLQVSGGGNSGQALAEIYDLDPIPSPLRTQLVNASSIGSVSGRSALLIAGFVVVGNSPQTVLIRGIGPGLSQFGVPGVLATPSLAVYDGKATLVAQNQAWGTPLAVSGGPTPATASDIAVAASGAGAFPLVAGSNDSSVLVVLAPGVYTAQLSGANNASGTGLVEIYVIK